MLKGVFLAFPCIFGSTESPVYGGMSELGYYFVDVLVGSPVQRVSAIIDTGSEGLSITCSACQNCGTSHMDPFYNPHISSTFARLKECLGSNLRNPMCLFEKRYLEGSSLKGRMVSDAVGFENNELRKKIAFGCIDHETKLFRDQKANGLMGLAPSQRTAWLFGEPKIGAFTLCLAKHGGHIAFFPSIEKPREAVSLMYRNGHYTIEPVSIGLSGGDLDWISPPEAKRLYLGNEVLIDSGSTETYIVRELFEKLESIIRERVEQDPIASTLVEDKSGQTLCWISDVSNVINPLLPSIVLTLPLLNEDGNTTKAFFTDYTYVSASRTCLGIASNGHLNRTDLGASWLINRKVTLTSTEGWAAFEAAACTDRSLDSREPVVALPGQLVESGVHVYFTALAVLSTVSLLLFLIIRRQLNRDTPGYNQLSLGNEEHVS